MRYEIEATKKYENFIETPPCYLSWVTNFDWRTHKIDGKKKQERIITALIRNKNHVHRPNILVSFHLYILYNWFFVIPFYLDKIGIR